MSVARLVDGGGGQSSGLPHRYGNDAAYRRYLLTYALAALAIAAVWGGLLNVLLPLHVQQIEFARHFVGSDAQANLQSLYRLQSEAGAGRIAVSSTDARLLGLLAEFDAARAAQLSLVTSIGVFTTMLVQPLVGTFSDRTRSRWGRRSPFIVGGALVAALGLAGFTTASSIAALVMLWSLVQMATNAAMGPLQATVPDRVHPSNIGKVSAITGLGGMLGLVFGGIAAGALFTRFGTAAYLPFALVLVACCSLFVLVATDRSSSSMAVEHFSWVDFLRSFTIALRDHDFRWAWTGKVLVMFAFAVSTALTIYMLQSYIEPSLSAAEAATTAPLLLLSALPGILLAMIVSGRWSDRTGRRKPFIIASALLLAFSMTLPLVSPTLPALFAQAILAGIALGGFLIVDQALFIDVLPDQTAAGRDLGVAALGGNLGQALGPVLAGTIIAATGSYPAIWAAGLVAALLAALAIHPIKAVR